MGDFAATFGMSGLENEVQLGGLTKSFHNILNNAWKVMNENEYDEYEA